MATRYAEAATLSIGEVARAVGLRASAIRYYEDAGLLPRAARIGGKRRYDPETIDRLLLVRFCQRLGFALSEIRRITRDPPGGRAKQLWRELVDAKLAEISALVKSAKSVERILRESRDCDCVTLSGCRFLRQELERAPARFSIMAATTRQGAR